MSQREVFQCSDWHVAGQGVRIVESGYPVLPVKPLAQYPAYLAHAWDPYRRWLLEEPWGHEDLQGCVVTPPERPTSVVGFVALSNAGALSLSGSVAMALGAWLVETRRIPVDGAAEVPLLVDGVRGPVALRVDWDGNRVRAVELGPLGCRLGPEGLVAWDGREVPVSLVWADAWYAMVPAAAFPVPLRLDTLDYFRAATAALCRAIEDRVGQEPRGIEALVVMDENGRDGALRQATLYGDGFLSRAPGGGAAAARAALMARDRRIPPGAVFPIESVLGTRLEARWEADGPTADACRVRLWGTPHLTAYRRFVRDPSDAIVPFLVR